MGTALLSIIAVAVGIFVLLKMRTEKFEVFINEYTFPQSVFTNITKKYPHLKDRDLKTIERALRQYFHVCLHTRNKMASMPSQVVDEAWHNFILFTKDYKIFCSGALGKFLHHVPAEAMKSKTDAQIGIKRTWKVCCAKEKIDPKSPDRLPLLFSIDADLNIPDGFHYSLDCSSSKNDNYCASGIGCSGCGGGSSDSSGCGGCGGD